MLTLPSIDNKLCARIKDVAYHDRQETRGEISFTEVALDGIEYHATDALPLFVVTRTILMAVNAHDNMYNANTSHLEYDRYLN